ncbi:ribonuclease YeeF family protein [Cytobacillus oceanisediminis]|uniref:ribonuclease YeeF family protein n=1 Tax=Cytobacillus oceanisediminis TaxID=665099 RepID=UPI00203E496E|nr:LXG domain-containing protein [Cytobacillus oceanisediminis]MCM3393126.1 LXG domain-containing protein [Cytobacillus oceanisediminis]
MKVLDVNELLTSTKLIRNQLNIFKDQITQIRIATMELVSLEDSFQGEGGRSIRSFYQECHLPFLLFFETWIDDYKSYLNQLDKNIYNFEPSPTGFIRQEYLEHELNQGLVNNIRITAELVEEANEIMRGVSDIVPLPQLKDDRFIESSNRAKHSPHETVVELNKLDHEQTVALDPLFNELNLMEQYIQKMANMFQSGILSLTSYQPKTLNWEDSLEELSNLNPESEQGILHDMTEGFLEGGAKAVGDTWEGIKTTYELGRTIMGPFSPLFLGNELLFNRDRLLENQREYHEFYLSLLNDPLGKVRRVLDMPKYIWSAVSTAWERDVVNGDAKSRTAFFTYGLTSLGMGIIGEKGIGKAGTIAKTIRQAGKGEKAIFTPVHTPALAAGGFAKASVPYNTLHNTLAQIKNVTENVFGPKGITNNHLYRGDSLLHSPTRPNGIGKPYISSSGDLVPASRDGLYKGRQVTVTEHILGGYRKGAKSHSPYTSFTNNKSMIGNYGEYAIKLDISVLRKDIQSGKVKDVVILSPKQIQKLIERDTISSDFWKNRAINWTKRDNEYLIKGVVPSQYIKVSPKE